MTKARSLRIGHAEVAKDPAAEMAGVGSNHAILWENIVHCLAERARIDELRARLIQVRSVMVVARTDALARAVIAAARPCPRHTTPAKFGQQGHGGGFRVTLQGMLHRHLVTQLRRFDVDL